MATREEDEAMTPEEEVMTPEEVMRDIELFGALKLYADRDRNCTVGELCALCEDVKAAALAYARPIVAEECARFVDEYPDMKPHGLSNAIREHGKVKP